jgi:hypothetical protein
MNSITFYNKRTFPTKINLGKMATNREMLKEAIADAKAVKETAIANAKAALEEAFTPQLTSMLSMKLQEMEEEDLKEEGFGKGSADGAEGFSSMDEKALDETEDKEMMEVDLEELLAELNEEEDMDESLNEAEEEEDEESEESEEEGEPIELEDMTDEDLKTMIEDVIKDMIEAGELEAGHEGMENEEGAEDETEEEISDEEVDLAELLREIEDMDEEKEPMYESEEELEELFGMGKKGKNYKTVIAQLLADNDDAVKALAAETDPAKKKDLADPLLRKAFAEFGKLQKENPAEKVIDNMNEFKREILGDSRSLLQKLAAGTGSQVAAREGKEEVDELFGLGKASKNQKMMNQLLDFFSKEGKNIRGASELIQLDPMSDEFKSKVGDILQKEDVTRELGSWAQRTGSSLRGIDVLANFRKALDLSQTTQAGYGKEGVGGIAMAETELAEALSTIDVLKAELNEINLLNAKLLYTNKIFKAKNLNESQKVKVLSSFDKAKNVGEVKMVFETLNEGIKVSKNPIKENLGSASKSTMTPNVKKPIVESNEAFARMQKLAGII